MCWPCKRNPEAPERAPYYMSNLNSSIKAAVMKSAETGYSNQNTLYGELHDKIRPHVDAKSSNHMWTDTHTPFSQIRAVLKYRWGVLWNARTAQRMGMHYKPWGCQSKDNNKNNNKSQATCKAAKHAPPNMTMIAPCPLCGHPDGGTHTLAGCQNAHLKALYIRRHDDAVKIIHKSISKGSKGGCYTIMDAGRAADLPEEVAGKRLPSWLLPNVDDSERLKLRPDILIIEGLNASKVPNADVSCLRPKSGGSDWQLGLST